MGKLKNVNLGYPTKQSEEYSLQTENEKQKKKNLSAKRQLARQREWEARDEERLCRCPRREWSRQNERWELVAAAYAVTRHPSHCDAAAGFNLLQPSHFTLNWLKYLIYPSKSQNLCLWCLCFSESVLVFFFLAFWLCDYLCVFVNCDSVFVCDYLCYII